ncbi:MAG: 50S ribosomal protein L15 [Planctomycetes bacterium]|nr:50S ribosomal protein L15 [Planctomycetota bacterium]
MNLSQAVAYPVERRRRRRVGRGKGCGRGKTCGHGGKGQKGRSGVTFRGYFEGGTMPFVRRIPKRGFVNTRFRTNWALVNCGDLARFPAGSTVAPKDFLEAGLISDVLDGVKILGDGELGVALTVQANRFSRSAEARILKAGGKVEWLTPKPKKAFVPKPPPPPVKEARPAKGEGKPAKGEGKGAKGGEKGKGKEGGKPPSAEGKAPKPPKGGPPPGAPASPKA